MPPTPDHLIMVFAPFDIFNCGRVEIVDMAIVYLALLCCVRQTHVFFTAISMTWEPGDI